MSGIERVWLHLAFSAVTLSSIMSARADLVRTVRSFPERQPEAYLGNGMIGYRVKPIPFLSWKAAASGFVKGHEDGRFETLCYAPYPFAMNFKLGDSPWLLDSADRIKVVEQRLDMSRGELVTELEAPLGGSTAHIEVLQFVSRTCPVVACQEVRLTVPKDGELTIVESVVSGPGNNAYAGTLSGFEKVTDIMLGWAPKDDMSKCGVAVKVDFGEAKVTREEFEAGKPQTARTFHSNVVKGQQFIIRSTAATVSSAYHPQPELEACRLLNWAASLGFDKLRTDNAEAWREIWKSRVEISGDDRAQDYLDCSLFYLFSSAHASCRTGIPPFGLSQVANYYGHVFWDMDTYMMPALLLTSPRTARATIDYRRRNLDAAQRRAETYGFNGAMYPWESDSHGFEATPANCDTGWLEQHVNMCVAIGAWQYQQVAGDREYARTHAWPILESVARWIESRVVRTDRGYEIRNVMSAAEGLTVNSSCYVDAIAAEALRDACSCARILGITPPERWKDIAARLFIPTGPATGAPAVNGDIIYMHEAGWEKEPSVDMFMLGFPFDLPLDRGLLRRTYDFYVAQPRRVLSMGEVFFIGDAAFLGDRRGARRMLDRLMDDTFEPVWGMGTEYSNAETTCFVTTMGGMLQTALMAFTGLRFDQGNWAKYDACLPEGWTRIKVDRIYLGEKPFHLEAEDGKKAVLTPATKPRT